MKRMTILKTTGLAMLAALVLLMTGCDGLEGRSDEYFAKGKAFFEAGDFERAKLELKNALQIDNKHAEAWYLLGRLEERDRNFPKAYGNYSKAIEIDPAQNDARVRRALLLLASGEADRAQEDIDAVLVAQPDHADALAARATLKRRQRDNEGAEADARRSLAADPANIGAALFLASLETERENYPAAEKILQDAIRLNPDNAAPRLILGSVYDRMGDADAAIGVLNDLVEQFPDQYAYRVRLSSYLTQKRRFDAAEDVLRKALMEQPDDIERQRTLIAFLATQRGAAAAEGELAVLRGQYPESIELKFIQSGMELKRGDVAAAKDSLQLIIDAEKGIGPNAIKARNALAELLLKEKDFDGAAKLIAVTLEEEARDPDALFLRSLINLQNKAYDQAVVDLRSVTREKPDKALAWRLLGQAHVAQGELDLAQDAFEKAAALEPDDLVSKARIAELKLRKGDTSGAKVDLEQILEQSPEALGAHVALGRINFAEQNWDALSESGERLKETLPDNPMGTYLQGVALQRQQRHEEAIAAFEQALALQPDAAEPLVALVQSHVAIGQSGQAIDRVQAVLATKPDNAIALNLLGSLYLVERRNDEALQAYEQAIAANPAAASAYLRVARLQIASGDLDAARATLQKGLSATESHPTILAEFAMVAQRQDDYDGAVEAYELLLARYPNSALAINNLAMLLATKVADEAAMTRAYQLAEALKESDQALFVDTVGWIYHLRGDYEEAGRHLERANTLQPGISEIEHHLGLNYVKLGNQAEARKFLAAAAADEQYSGRQEAAEALDQLGGQG